MSEQNVPQLLMRIPSLDHLPEIVLPENPATSEKLTIHTEDARSAESWERIIKDAFGTHIPYDSMRKDPAYRPDRIFFVREHSYDIATAAAYYREKFPGEGYVHMVGTHPWALGVNAGYYAVLAVLHQFRREGVHSAVLNTDDFRLPAIKTYLKLGFEPVMDHETSEKRWAEVMKKLAEYKKPAQSAIALWPGEAPYTAKCGGQAQPTLQPFPAKGSRGAVVICPGGGYAMKCYYEGPVIARMLKAAGISAYVLDYRVNPCPFEAPLADAQRAIRLLRSMGYEKVGVLGFSAGGHLTCSAATLYDLGDPDAADPVERFSSRPDAFVPCYAVVSFAAFRHQGSLEMLLGDRAEDISLIRRFSAELHVDGNTPPAFIWHTAADSAVPVENSLSLAQALAHAGVPFEMHIFPEGEHGLGLGGGFQPVQSWPEMCQQWLLRQGFGK